MRQALVCVGRLGAGPEGELAERYFNRLADARDIGVAGVDPWEIDEWRARDRIVSFRSMTRPRELV
jgi:hypothetical protein